MTGDGQVSTTVKDVRGDGADSELSAEESQLAVLENAGHQSVSLGGDVQANPEQRELGIKPVQTKQQTAFGELIHADTLSANVVKPLPYYARTPGAECRRGSMTSREERA